MSRENLQIITPERLSRTLWLARELHTRKFRLTRRDPDLVSDNRHHEQQVEAQRPENEQFGAFEMATRDGMLLGVGELVVFERGQNQDLIGG